VTTTATGTLEAVARGAFSATYALRRDGEEVGTAAFSHWRVRGTLTLGDQTFTLERRRREPGRPFLLLHDGRELARAIKPSAFRDAFEVHLGPERLTLRQRGLVDCSFRLYRDGEEIGVLRQRGVLRRRVRLALPSEWPLPLAAFLLFLARVVWTREQAAAGA